MVAVAAAMEAMEDMETQEAEGSLGFGGERCGFGCMLEARLHLPLASPRAPLPAVKKPVERDMRYLQKYTETVLREFHSREVPVWARPPPINIAGTRAEDTWHRRRGRGKSAEPGESLNQMLNQPETSALVPPSTPPNVPMLTSGVDRTKRLHVHSLYKTMSVQSARESTRVSVESVCLTQALRSPRGWTTTQILAAEPSQRQHVRLPLLRLKSDEEGPQALHHMHNALAAESATPTQRRIGNRTPARRNFLQTAEGWQPWRTHQPSAFDESRRAIEQDACWRH